MPPNPWDDPHFGHQGSRSQCSHCKMADQDRRKRSDSRKKRRRATAVCVNSKGEVLLVRDKGKRRYSLPGGGVNPNEPTISSPGLGELEGETATRDQGQMSARSQRPRNNNPTPPRRNPKIH